jgi:ribosomal protein S27AE
MGRPKTGNFTVAKSITLNLSTAAFLEEQCIKNNSKLSPYINGLVEQERQRIEKIDSRPKDFCNVCGDMTPHNRDFSCGNCGKHNEALKRRVDLYMNGPKQ